MKAAGFCREVKVVTVREESASRLEKVRFDCALIVFRLWVELIARARSFQQDKEHCFCFSLDTRCWLKNFCLVSLGSLNETIVHPREVFRPAIADCAHSIIVAHNHPSGDPQPSLLDAQLTRRLSEAGELLQIPLQDHIIIGDRKYFSFRDNCQHWPPRLRDLRQAFWKPGRQQSTSLATKRKSGNK